VTCGVLIGIPRTDYTLVESVIQARLRGVEIFLADQEAALATCPDYLPVAGKIALSSLSLKAATQSLCRLAPQFVISFSEFNLVLAAQVRERLGLPGLSVEVEERVRKKHHTRERLRDCGLSNVDFAIATFAQLREMASGFKLPFVIKPVDMTGSIGVYGVRSKRDIDHFRNAFVDLKREETRQREFMIEAFIEGDEYSVEGICLKGHFHLLAVTRKYTNSFPNFAEIGHTLPATVSSDNLDYGTFIQAIVNALNIDTAPIHAEVKAKGDRIELVEIHTRFGGDYIPLLLERAFGYKVFAMYYDALLYGTEPEKRNARVISGIQFLERKDLSRLVRLPRQWEDITYSMTMKPPNTASVQESLDNIRILNSRVGHIIFDAPSHGRAEQFVDDLRIKQRASRV